MLLWGLLIALLVGTGKHLTIRSGTLQLVRLPKAFSWLYQGQGTWGCIELCCSMYSSKPLLLNGNIIGAATAIGVGGQVLFLLMWMAAFRWQTGHAEGFLLAIKYRTKDKWGCSWGPMHYILLGMEKKWRPLLLSSFALAVYSPLGDYTHSKSIRLQNPGHSPS